MAIQLRLRYSQSLKPCELQRPIPNQILLSTLSSLGITGIPLRWFESYITGRSFRVAWGGEVSKAHQLVTGVPQESVLGPLLFSTYTTSLGPIIQAHGFSYHCYADDTQLYLSFQPDDPTVAARISGWLADISAWMKEHHLQLNLAKTELLVVPATPTLQHDFSIQLGTSIITPSTSVRNLGVIFDDQLTFKEHIAKTARSCRFALHNIRKIRPFLTDHAAHRGAATDSGPPGQHIHSGGAIEIAIAFPRPSFFPLLPNQIILFQLLKLFSFVCNGTVIIFSFCFL